LIGRAENAVIVLQTCVVKLLRSKQNDKTRMALSRVRTSAEAADDAKLLPSNKRRVRNTSSRVEYGGAAPNRDPNNPNLTRSGLPPKCNGFFRGLCATFPPNSVKILVRSARSPNSLNSVTVVSLKNSSL